MRAVRLAGAAIAAALLLVSTAPAARASCAALPPGDPYGDAPLVFVGKVAATGHDGFEAHVVVEQVWRGQVPQRIFTVIGGPLDHGVGQEDSRRFSAGTTYVFDAHGDGPSFHDNACSATLRYEQVPTRYRPTGLPSPTADLALVRRASAAADGWPVGAVTGGVAVALAAAALAAVTAWRLRRRTRPSL